MSFVAAKYMTRYYSRHMKQKRQKSSENFSKRVVLLWFWKKKILLFKENLSNLDFRNLFQLRDLNYHFTNN